ncbi:ribosomal protein L7/L12 [Clostridium sp. MSJ-4]|uniref:Ribosomal protein L7/L12 n=1 Tax=Clostridium simiarum TaxID=2841506 RepID=A0ABS6F438_9CLOT|nr:ribosomal protein L7/L12 [Clostridium simiarum]MBU5593277.1 ribosomal protein L7/L12 [Clostridium simiarum]
MEYTIIGVLLMATSLLIMHISELKDRMSRMNSTLQKIASKVGVEEPFIDQNELRSLIAEGKKVQAVKKVRMDLGLGLKEAKEYVDNLDKI